jgi:hypothetical protein
VLQTANTGMLTVTHNSYLPLLVIQICPTIHDKTLGHDSAIVPSHGLSQDDLVTFQHAHVTSAPSTCLHEIALSTHASTGMDKCLGQNKTREYSSSANNTGDYSSPKCVSTVSNKPSKFLHTT